MIVLNTINGIKVFDQISLTTGCRPDYASATLGTYLYSIAFGAMGASNSPAPDLLPRFLSPNACAWFQSLLICLGSAALDLDFLY